MERKIHQQVKKYEKFKALSVNFFIYDSSWKALVCMWIATYAYDTTSFWGKQAKIT